MGFISPSAQPVEPSEFLKLPFLQRIRVLSTNWVDDGFGTPRVLHVIYVLKMFGLYLAGGIFIATLTSDIAFTDVASWWDNAVVY